MRVKVGMVEVEGTPDELEWFLDEGQTHARRHLQIMHGTAMMNASVSTIPLPPEDGEEEGPHHLEVLRGGKAPEEGDDE